MSGRNGTMFYHQEISPSMIYHYLEKVHFHSIFDPLASTSGGTGYFKLQNVRVISNDYSLYSYVRGKAFWENNIFTIPDEILEAATNKESLASLDAHRFDEFDETFLDQERKEWLSRWYEFIDKEDDEYIQALFQSAVLSCVDYWITTDQYKVEAAFDPISLLKFYLTHANRQVMHNHESNEIWLGDPMKLVPKVSADAMFLNPPELKGYASFGRRERVAEAWLRGTPNFDIENLAPPGSLGSRFEKVDDYMRVLREFLDKAEHIQLWIIALSNRQPFTRLALEEIMRARRSKMVVVDIELPESTFSHRAVHTVLLAGG